MSPKKPVVKKQESNEEKIQESAPKIESKKEYKANRNFFFAGKNWFKDGVVDLPGKDIEFLLSKEVIS
jgi:hypothetical protein